MTERDKITTHQFLEAHRRAACYARTPAGRDGILGEWMVSFRKVDGLGCYMVYWDSSGKQRAVAASEYEVDRFCESLQREWGKHERPEFD